MKKFISGLFILLSTLILFSNCKMNFEDADLLTKPDVEPIIGDEVNSEGKKIGYVSISIPRQSADTRYINLYRKDIDDKEAQIVNIGLLYPSVIESTGSVYVFIDSMVIENHKYAYMARYCESDGYYSTQWSNEIEIKGGYKEGEVLKYRANGATFSINDVDYTLRINGDILSPDAIKNFDKDFCPMLIVSSNGKTQVFKIESLTNNSVISLRGYLPQDFLNHDVTIVGIVGQKTDTVPTENLNADPIVRRIFWTEPTDIPLKGYNNKTIFIPSANGSDGVDYSRKADNLNY